MDSIRRHSGRFWTTADVISEPPIYRILLPPDSTSEGHDTRKAVSYERRDPPSSMTLAQVQKPWWIGWRLVGECGPPVGNLLSSHGCIIYSHHPTDRFVGSVGMLHGHQQLRMLETILASTSTQDKGHIPHPMAKLEMDWQCWRGGGGVMYMIFGRS